MPLNIALSHPKKTSARIIVFALFWLLSSPFTLARAQSQAAVAFCIGYSIEGYDLAYELYALDAGFLGANVYESLLDVRELNKNTPSLATDWDEIVADQQYRFKLRRGVEFHPIDNFKPSRPMSAVDVVYSLGRLVDNKHSIFSFAAGTVIEAIDEYTVELRTPEPVENLFDELTKSGHAPILSAEYAELHPEKTPPYLSPGTGPFWPKADKSLKSQSLERFDRYWGTKALSKRIELKIISEAEDRFTALRQGTCHIAFSLNPIHKAAADKIKELVRVHSGLIETTAIYFNTAKSPTDQIKLRRAIALAIDRDKLARVFNHSKLTASRSLVPHTIEYNDKIDSTPYDPERAKQLLKQLKTPTTHINLERLSSGHFISGRLAQLIKNDLNKVGIELSINAHQEIASILQAFASNGANMTILDWVSEVTEPASYLDSQLSCSGSGEQNNITHWCSSEFDRLLARARHSNDPSLIAQAAQLADRQAPLVPLWYYDIQDLMSEKVQGYKPGFYLSLHTLELRD